MNAMEQTGYVNSYQSLNLTWTPVVDGVILKHTLRESLSMGKYARVSQLYSVIDTPCDLWFSL